MSATKPEDLAPIVDKIRPLLAGKPPELQGAVLADLVAMFIAGHAPPLRDEIFEMHVDLVRELIPVNEGLMFPNGAPWGR